MQELTEEQRSTIRDLQKELDSLDLRADVEWAKYMHTKDEACYDEVLALESEREMKGLIAYIPKAGERKIGKVRQLITKAKQLAGQDCKDCDLGESEARLLALESVNDWRHNYDLPPLDRLPRGIPGDPNECTLAKAFQISLKDMGVTDANVEVNSWDSVNLEGYNKNGTYWSDSPVLTSKGGGQVIEGFDQHAWLDLLSDGSLAAYADSIAINHIDGYDSDESRIARLQEICDELHNRREDKGVARGDRARDLTFPVTWWSHSYGDDRTFLCHAGLNVREAVETLEAELKAEREALDD